MSAARIDLDCDGHTHSEFCPHGSREPLERYLDRAVELGLRRYCVTEHIPLPTGFVDPMGPYECAGPAEDLAAYLTRGDEVRAAYADRLTVFVGLEIDWLGGAQGNRHADLLAMLAPVWDRLAPEATLLSVHFVGSGLVDGTPDLAAGLVPPGASIDALHLRYYTELRAALTASWRHDGRDLRPRRVSHLTLPRKFVRRQPLAEPERVWAAADEVLELIAREGLELDLNTAGLDKPDCGEIYLPEPLLSRALALGIPLVFGSDAHAAREVGRHREVVAGMVAEGGN